MQLRVESYNTFNHTNFSSRDATARFSGPDQINPLFLTYSAANNQRRLQFAARMNW